MLHDQQQQQLHANTNHMMESHRMMQQQQQQPTRPDSIEVKSAAYYQQLQLQQQQQQQQMNRGNGNGHSINYNNVQNENIYMPRVLKNYDEHESSPRIYPNNTATQQQNNFNAPLAAEEQLSPSRVIGKIEFQFVLLIWKIKMSLFSQDHRQDHLNLLQPRLQTWSHLLQEGRGQAQLKGTVSRLRHRLPQHQSQTTTWCSPWCKTDTRTGIRVLRWPWWAGLARRRWQEVTTCCRLHPRIKWTTCYQQEFLWNTCLPHLLLRHLLLLQM